MTDRKGEETKTKEGIEDKRRDKKKKKKKQHETSRRRGKKKRMMKKEETRDRRQKKKRENDFYHVSAFFLLYSPSLPRSLLRSYEVSLRTLYMSPRAFLFLSTTNIPAR